MKLVIPLNLTLYLDGITKLAARRARLKALLAIWAIEYLPFCNTLINNTIAMSDEIIAKIANITFNILAYIGIGFLISCTMHISGPHAYFTPKLISELPFWILGIGSGYLISEFYKGYK